MASVSNNVTIATDLNVDPYYDDFDESKNYHRILFRPSLAVQARELTQIQSVLQNQIDRFASNIFKEGSKVSGCETNYDQNYQYVKLRNNTFTNAITNVYSFQDRIITGNTSGVRALVINVNDGSEANTPNFKTLFVKYIGANTSGSRLFTNNEILNSTTGSFTANTIKSAQGSATGHGTAFSVGSGVIYAKDHFIRVSEQSVVVSKYSANTTARVGWEIKENILTELDDESLLDPASGSTNYSAPGAARFKLTPTLVIKAIGGSSTNNFIEIIQVSNGMVTTSRDDTQYNYIRDYMARRTFDESGDYIINGLSPRLREHLISGTNQGLVTAAQGGSSRVLAVSIEPGKAVVRGYDIEKLTTSNVILDKGVNYESVSDSALIGNIGNYVIVDNLAGNWDVNNQLTVTLRADQANSVSEKLFSQTGSRGGASLGTARVRAVEYYTGTPGLPSAQYKLYLSDINVTEGGKSFANVASFSYSAGVGYANGKADIIGTKNGTSASANTQDSAYETAIITLPAKAIRKLRDSSDVVDNQWQFSKQYDVTLAATTGIGTIASGAASETFTGSGVVSDAIAREYFIVVVRGTGNTSNMAGTVSKTNGSNTITGSGTAFATTINPGDLVNFGGEDFIVSTVTNATTLNTLAAATSTASAKVHYKKFRPGQIIDMGGVGSSIASRSANTNTNSVTLSTKEALTATLTCSVIAKMNKIDGQEAGKTVNRNQLVQIRVGAGGGTSYTATTTGPWPIGRSDGFKLIAVRKKSGSNFSSTSEGIDVTSHFSLDTGMRDSLYDHASLVKNARSTLAIANGDRLLVTFDNFTHSYSSGVGYFSVDSYPVDDALAGSDTSKIYTYDIPRFTSPKTGTSYDLRDSIDFRPRITDTANSVTTLTNISINPLTSTSIDLPSGGLRFIYPNETFTVDYSYYLKRRDLIVMDGSGHARSVRGTPSLQPLIPEQPDGTMLIATVSIAPYPSLPDEIARRANRLSSASAITAVKNQRFTMRDIGVIRDRVDRLEYYTSLSLLEGDSKNLLVQDENGLDRFKNGIITDSFTGHGTGNVYDADHRCSIDAKNGELRPAFKIDNVELFNFSANSSNVVRTNVFNTVSRDQTVYISNSQVRFSNNSVVTGSGAAYLRYQVENKLYLENATIDFVAATTITQGAVSTTSVSSDLTTQGELITLPYSHKVMTSQLNATTTRNTAGLLYSFAGIVELSPDNDYWIDTAQLPDVQSNFDFSSDNLMQLPGSGLSPFATNWGSWTDVVTGTPVVTSNSREYVTGTHISGTGEITEDVATEETKNSVTQISRTGIRAVIIPTTQIQNLGTRVKNVNIQPFMRSRTINVTGHGFKPSARLYAFFDGTNVSAYITPYKNGLSSANTGAEGSALTATATGQVYAEFRIPSEAGLRFRTGDRTFRLTDNPTNKSGLGLVTTAGDARYSAQGLNTQTQDTVVSTRVNKIGTESVNELSTRASSGSSTSSRIRVVGQTPAPPAVTNVNISYGGDTVNIHYDIHNNIVTNYITDGDINNYDTTVGVVPVSVANPPETPYYPVPQLPPGAPATVVATTAADGNITIVPSNPAPIPADEPLEQQCEGIWEWREGPMSSIEQWTHVGDDPIAQSFTVPPGELLEKVRSPGLFVTKIDVYFSTKDDTLPVTVEIREMANGTITPNVVPFARATLYPNYVNVSDDATAPTPFYFPSPVYLMSGQDYAFIVRPGGGNPNYSAYTAVLGENDLSTGNRITAQPAVGILFVSSNDNNWNPIQDEDLKFAIYYAKFPTNPGRLINGAAVFKNENMDFFSVSGNTYATIGEQIVGETQLYGTFVPGQGLRGNVASSLSFVQGMTSGATGTITSFSANNILVKNVTTSVKFKGREKVRFRLASIAGAIAGNSTGAIISTVTPYGYLAKYDTLDSSNTIMHLSNVAYSNSGPAAACTYNRIFKSNTYVRGQIGGYNTKINSINSLKMDVLNFNTDFLQPTGTKVSFFGRFARSTSTRDAGNIPLNINNDNEFPAPRYVLSYSTAANTALSSSVMNARRSAEVRSVISTTNPLVSPALDVRRISGTTIENLINDTIVGEANTAFGTGGKSLARYITRRITLDEGQDAEDLVVYLTAYKPASSEVTVFYKVLHSEDSDTFTTARWIPMTQTTATTVVSDTTQTGQFLEYQYNIPTYDNMYLSGANTASQPSTNILEYRNSRKARYQGFKYFAIKIVLTSETSTNPPRVKNLRAIALQR